MKCALMQSGQASKLISDSQEGQFFAELTEALRSRGQQVFSVDFPERRNSEQPAHSFERQQRATQIEKLLLSSSEIKQGRLHWDVVFAVSLSADLVLQVLQRRSDLHVDKLILYGSVVEATVELQSVVGELILGYGEEDHIAYVDEEVVGDSTSHLTVLGPFDYAYEGLEKVHGCGTKSVEFWPKQEHLPSRDAILRLMPLIYQRAFAEHGPNFAVSPVHKAVPGAGRIRRLFNEDSIEIADVACGTGHFSHRVRHPSDRISFVDPSPFMLEQIPKRPQDRILQAHAENLPLESASVDLLLCRYALHHFVDVPRFFSEAWRVLKPHGCFVLVDLETPESYLESLMHDIEIWHDPTHVQTLSRSHLEGIAHCHGLIAESGHSFLGLEEGFSVQSWCDVTGSPHADRICQLLRQLPEKEVQKMGFICRGAEISHTVPSVEIHFRKRGDHAHC